MSHYDPTNDPNHCCPVCTMPSPGGVPHIGTCDGGPRPLELVPPWTSPLGGPPAVETATLSLDPATVNPDEGPRCCVCGTAAANAGGGLCAGCAAALREVWGLLGYQRGRFIEDVLALTDYAGWVRTDNLDPFMRARNFPLIDFMAPDGSVAVSVKTVDPFTGRFTAIDHDTHMDLFDHACELADHAPGDRVVLDIRVPPDTPDSVLQALDVGAEVDDPRLEVIVRRWP